MKRTYKTLILGELAEIDDAFNAALLQERHPVELIEVKKIEHFREAIQDPDIDLIVIDIVPYGLDMLEIVMEKAPMRSMIMVGDIRHVDVLLEAQKRGMQLSMIRVESATENQELLLLEIRNAIEQLAEPPSMKYITVASLMRYAQYHNVHQPFLVADMNGRLIYFNHAADSLIEQLHGHKPRLGDSSARFFLSDKLETFSGYLDRAYSGEEFKAEYTFEVLDEAEKYREILYQPVRTEAQDVIAVSMDCINVGARQKAHEKLVRREEALWTYFELVPLPLIVIHDDLVVERGNPAFLNLLQLNSARVLHGENICDFVYPDDQDAVRNAFERLFSAETNYFQGEHRYCNEDGTIVWVKHIGFAIDHAEGEHRSALIIAVDVTARKEAEDQRQQFVRMNAIGELASGVAHDFNNILAIVGAISHLLKEELANSGFDELVVYTDKMIQAVDRGSSLTHQLLSFSQDERIEQEIIDLNSHVCDIYELLSEALGDNIKLEIRLDPDPLLIQLGKGQIDQITMNFVVNARDAMPGGGTLRITTSRIHVHAAEAAPREDLPVGDWAMFTFSDEGTGMDRETKRRIFEPFYTTKAPGKGTGMGLATISRIVDRMGGKVYVDSEPGQGTTFTLYLPIAEQHPDNIISSALRQPHTEDENQRTPCILLVEDEEDLRKPYRIFLEKAGFQVLEAASIEQALATFDKHADVIDLLLADVVLPDGSGVAFASSLQERRPDLRVVFISGYAPDLIYSEPQRHGRKWLFLPKPASREKLVSIVHTSLGLANT